MFCNYYTLLHLSSMLFNNNKMLQVVKNAAGMDFSQIQEIWPPCNYFPSTDSLLSPIRLFLFNELTLWLWLSHCRRNTRIQTYTVWDEEVNVCSRKRSHKRNSIFVYFGLFTLLSKGKCKKKHWSIYHMKYYVFIVVQFTSVSILQHFHRTTNREQNIFTFILLFMYPLPFKKRV